MHARIEDRNFLDRAHDDDGALEIVAHGSLCARCPSAERGCWNHGGEIDGQADEFVAENGSANEAFVIVIEIGDSDGCAWVSIVKDIVIHQTDSSGVGVALEISANPVVAIA